MHVIAGKAVAFGEALRPEFKTYLDHVVENAAALGEGMAADGLRHVSGGTDHHLCLVDLTPAGSSGKAAETLLDAVGLTVNKKARMPRRCSMRWGSPSTRTRSPARRVPRS